MWGSDGVLNYCCSNALHSYSNAVHTSEQVTEPLLFPRHCHEHSAVLTGVARISSFTPPAPLKQKCISLQNRKLRPGEDA